MIRESNPLENYPISIVFPVLKPLTCQKDVAQENQENEQPLLQRKQTHSVAGGKKRTQVIEEEERRKDPYLVLGFGMIAYRDMLFTLILLFSVLTVIMAPGMAFFNKYEGIAPATAKAYMTYSLGNMGYSSS